MVFLCSCVGTIDDKNSPQSNILNSPTSQAATSFDGIYKAQAISHDKVEILFRPAVSTGEVVYELYINNSSIPLRLYEKSLIKNSAGYYYYLVSGLQLNSTYMFNMKASPVGETSSTANQIDPNKSVYVTTFKNETADFLGISSVTLDAGEAGKNSVIVRWTPATINGTDLNIRDSDPVAYEIKYISSEGGAGNLNNGSYEGTDRFTVRYPTTDSNPPLLSRQKEATIRGLQVGTTYYFQVRAIHKAYLSNSDDVFYKREENTRYLKITTLTDSGLFDFPTGLATLNHPLGEAGLSSLDVTWLPATGEFNHYRVCYKKVANPEGMAPLDDQLQDTVLDSILNNNAYCIKAESSAINLRLTGLVSYAYYQVKVLACKTVDCTLRDRISSDVLSARVTTNLAQFGGIQTLTNPVDETALDTISLGFDAPIVTSGYLSQMKLYCYANQSDSSPVELPTDGTFSSTSKPSCNGISVASTMPSSLSEYGLFNSLSLKFSSVVDGTKNYCLALVPVIESSYLTQTALNSASIYCFTPQIQTPTITEFSGKKPLCTSQTGTDLTFDWLRPSAGLYSNFIIFYREKITGSEFFSYQDATQDYLTSNALSPYKWIDGLSKDSLSYDILNLKPGATYTIGMLTYLTVGSTKVFSQFNNAIEDCFLPLPVGKFNEWVDVFAVGPKEDGLTPVTALGKSKQMIESLDDDGLPIELKLGADELSLELSDSVSASKTSLINFNGVYGAKNANSESTLYQYSNSGMVKLMWKDVSFFSNTLTMNDFIQTFETASATISKYQRKYGYKVYRSDDNQLTWVELTNFSQKNKFQTYNNSGPIYPFSLTWKKRNNAASENDLVVSFTDYSVSYISENGETDRARIYWYKVIPVFDGKELSYDDVNNPTHHIIRVTLPPRNMALVHRLVANRTICYELNKSIDKKAGKHYSCPYNGVGASGLTNPWVVGETVYDLGGDLLVDRFEMGCPFTRGDPSFENSDSTFENSIITGFNGLSKYGNGYRGCKIGDSVEKSDETNAGAYSPTSTYLFSQVIPGDCFNRDFLVPGHHSATACLNPDKITVNYYSYPGIGYSELAANCTNPNNVALKAFDYSVTDSKINTDEGFFPAQSETMAVFYQRPKDSLNWESHQATNYIGGNGKTFSADDRNMIGSCWLNLNYVNNTGKYRPRWLPLRALFSHFKVSGAENRTLSLYDKTPSEVFSDPDLYDSDNVVEPSFFSFALGRINPTSTKLGRIASSNKAKLPPLTGINQPDMNKLCSLYKVEVGLKSSSGSFISHSAVTPKRLLRRKEYIASAAWPQQYTESKVNQIEKGTYVENSIYKGCNGPEKIRGIATPVGGAAAIHKGEYIAPNFANADMTNTYFMTGSTFRDGNGINYSTEKCVSRFGIQDLVGNLKETMSEEIYCDYTKDNMYLGPQDDVLKSALYSSGFIDPDRVTPWVLSQADSGSCSFLENGSNTGTYQSNGMMVPIRGISGINSSIVKVQKSFDQDSVLASRNGDGGFMDFGQNSMAANISQGNIFDMEVADNPSSYFSPVLGMPLTCLGGCVGGADDNIKITSDRISLAKGYTTDNNPNSIEMLDFPINNSRVLNTGIAQIGSSGFYRTDDENLPAINYIVGVTDPGNGEFDANPENNFFQYELLVPGSNFPTNLYTYDYQAPRGGTFKMYSGGSSKNQPGRYSLEISSKREEEERFLTKDFTARCAVLINQDSQ